LHHAAIGKILPIPEWASKKGSSGAYLVQRRQAA